MDSLSAFFVYFLDPQSLSMGRDLPIGLSRPRIAPLPVVTRRSLFLLVPVPRLVPCELHITRNGSASAARCCDRCATRTLRDCRLTTLHWTPCARKDFHPSICLVPPADLPQRLTFLP